MVTLGEIFTDAGVPALFTQWITAKGFSSTEQFARIAINPEKLLEKIVVPFIDGVSTKGTDYKLPDDVDADYFEATVMMAWEKARLAVSHPPVVPPTGASASTPSLPIAPQPKPLEKAPKTLPPGVWKQQVDKFEQAFSPARTFPQKLLIGAEQVLARIWWERTESFDYTPIGLGELLRLRAFTADGQVNTLMTRAAKEEKLLGIIRRDGEPALSLRDKEYEPGSQWAIMDAFEAIKWALVWAGFALDDVVDQWIRIFTKMVRSQPYALDLVKSTYEAASWKLALQMRSGESFTAATTEIRKDTEWFREYERDFQIQRARWGPRGWQGQNWSSGWQDNPAPKRQRTAEPPQQQQPRSQQPPKQENKWDQAWNSQIKGKRICKDYQYKACTTQGPCPKNESHVCAKCLKGGHGATNCWAK